MNEIDTDATEINGVYEEYVKLQVSFTDSKKCISSHRVSIWSQLLGVNGLIALYIISLFIQELRREVIKGEQSFLNTLELNERLIAEAMLNEQQGVEYQGQMQSIAKSRNKLQRQIQETNSR